MKVTETRELLKEAAVYWEESFNGNFTHSSTLGYIAEKFKKEDKAGGIDKIKLLPSEKLILNNLLILANSQ